MKKPAPVHQESERQTAQSEIIARLRHALDNSYRRVREAARREWERHFTDKFDPSDACVTVRIRRAAEEKRPSLPGAAILRVRQTTMQKANRRLTRPRFAV
jgi:hypothetical protein